MIACIEKCRDPLRSILSALHSWVMTTYPDTVVSQPDAMDKDGWLHYAVPDGQGGRQSVCRRALSPGQADGCNGAACCEARARPDGVGACRHGKAADAGFCLWTAPTL